MRNPSNKEMADHSIQKPTKLKPDQLGILYKRHVQGAFVRSGASLFMGLYGLFAYLFGMIEADNMLGVSFCVAYLILINPPTLLILRFLTSRRLYWFFSVLINFLEITGYTTVIYFLGGINALYLSLIYAALIAYVGNVGPPRLPFIIASICSITLCIAVGLESYGIIPHRDPFWKFQPPLLNQTAVVLATTCLLFVVAFIASYTGGLLRKNKNKLREQNIELEQSRYDLKKAADRLEQKNIELELAVEKAFESDRMKSEFLANMSHEFRTPLNHIIGFTEIIVDKKVGDLNDNQEKYLDNVLESSKHLLSLVNDILDLSKIEAGKMELKTTDVIIKEFLENSLIMIKEKANKHGIKLTIHNGSIPETIKADERKLKQIMYNLLSNAVKFTPDGGKISLTTDIFDSTLLASQIEAPYQGAGIDDIDNNDSPLRHRSKGDDLAVLRKFIRISVADTGIGIKKEDLQRVFKPFEQADNTASRRYQGTGLGLSLTKKLVELHGGKIWAQSEGEGKGTVFSFIIPMDL